MSLSLNFSVVLSCNNQKVLLPLNEPTFGTRRKSQIQTYLEQNMGEGVQHIAVFTRDIVSTMRAMKSVYGGFEFQESLGPAYYASLRSRLQLGIEGVSPQLSQQQLADIEELGILADRDDKVTYNLSKIIFVVFSFLITFLLLLLSRVYCCKYSPVLLGIGRHYFWKLYKESAVTRTESRHLDAVDLGKEILKTYLKALRILRQPLK